MPARDYLGCVKPASSLVVLGSLYLGMVLGGSSLAVPLPEFLLLCLVGMGISGGAQTLNMYSDLELDRVSHPERPFPRGKVGGGRLLLLSSLLFSLSALSLLLGPPVLLLSLLGVLLGLLYSLPPLPLGRWYTSYPTSSLGYVFLPFLAGHLSLSPLTEEAVEVALLFTFLSLFLSPLKDLKDRGGDRKGGKPTLPARLGVRNTLVFSSSGLFFTLLFFLLLNPRGPEWFLSYLVCTATLLLPTLFFSEGLLRRDPFWLVRLWALASQLLFAGWWVYL
ncbi:MAG: UbiA family prenyltransferase [Candidatus Hadarchaeales archaeon]